MWLWEKVISGEPTWTLLLQWLSLGGRKEREPERDRFIYLRLPNLSPFWPLAIEFVTKLILLFSLNQIIKVLVSNKSSFNPCSSCSLDSHPEVIRGIFGGRQIWEGKVVVCLFLGLLDYISAFGNYSSRSSSSYSFTMCEKIQKVTISTWATWRNHLRRRLPLWPFVYPPVSRRCSGEQLARRGVRGSAGATLWSQHQDGGRPVPAGPVQWSPLRGGGSSHRRPQTESVRVSVRGWAGSTFILGLKNKHPYLWYINI